VNLTSSQVSEIPTLTSNGSCAHEDAICVPAISNPIGVFSRVHINTEKASDRIIEQWYATAKLEKSRLLGEIDTVRTGLQHTVNLKAAAALSNRVQRWRISLVEFWDK
jgi:hypothetical protein